MGRRSRLPVQAPLLGEDGPDAVVPAQALDPVLAGHDALLGEFVGDEPVSEGGIVVVDVPSGVNQMGIRQIPESQHPAGHRHGNAVGGKIRDQRLHL
jgi:predicted transcriptional regulator